MANELPSVVPDYIKHILHRRPKENLKSLIELLPSLLNLDLKNQTKESLNPKLTMLLSYLKFGNNHVPYLLLTTYADLFLKKASIYPDPLKRLVNSFKFRQEQIQSLMKPTYSIPALNEDFIKDPKPLYDGIHDLLQHPRDFPRDFPTQVVIAGHNGSIFLGRPVLPVFDQLRPIFTVYTL